MARQFAPTLFGDVVGRQLKTSSGKAESRRKLIGAVRAAASRMKLDDDDRRAIQVEMTGKRSMGDMSLAEIGKVLDRLNRDRPAPMAHRGHAGKIRALWWTLYWLGEIAEPNDAALDSFVRRQTGLAALRFLDHHRAPSVIEAQKAMAERAGVKWPDAVTSADTIARNPGLTGQLLDRHAVLSAIFQRLYDCGAVVSPWYHSYVQSALHLGNNHWAWTAHELDAAIRMLGKKLRRAQARTAERREPTTP